MNSIVVKQQFKLQQWAALIQQYHESGMNLKTWLDQNHITRDAYYYWNRKVRDAALDAIQPAFVELRPVKEAPLQSQIHDQNASTPSATIRCGGMEIDLYESSSSSFISSLIGAIRHAQ